MILNDKEIIELCQKGMISPFESNQIKKDSYGSIPSYGVSSFGYDIRVDTEFKLFKDSLEPLDIKNPKSYETNTFNQSYFDIPPGDMALCKSIEGFNIPDNIMAVAVGKSTWARLGLICNVTPLEAGWKGQLVIELSNTTKRAIRIWAGSGICQLMFFRGNRPLITYADRKGKYQNQTGVTGAMI